MSFFVEFNKSICFLYLKGNTHSTNSRISAGWQFKILQIASKVENLIAFALPVFKIEIFAIVISNFSESSVSYTVKSCSSLISIPFLMAKINIVTIIKTNI
jgi:hypothetical protein